MWSMRMRASRRAGKSGTGRNRSGAEGFHISGAEAICKDKDRIKIVKEYIDRALTHPKGEPDKIVITIEKVKTKPKSVSSLPIRTLECSRPSEATELITSLLESLGVSGAAIKSGLAVLTNRITMRGAAVISIESARRLEPDKIRGVRASCLGISRNADKALSSELKKSGINTTTVKEALVLASKVASCRQIVAEVCISDDPDYTIGYLASKRLGYIRIPNIKRKGTATGGRIFFVNEDADIEALVRYMEDVPVMITAISGSK